MIKKNKLKNINLGIELLRMNFSFLIVVYHIHSREIKNFILQLALYFLGFYTSTFFFISFYFSFRNLTSRIIIVTKERLLRILIPYIIWPIIIFVEENIYNYIYQQNFKYKIKDLIIQIVVGRKVNDVFWFQFNLIFISIIIIIFIFAFSKYLSFFLFHVLFFFAFLFNMKRFDLKIFKFYDICIFHSIGRLSYSFIYSMTGFFCGSFNILNKIKKNHKYIILVFSPILIYILKQPNKLFNKFPELNFLIIDILVFILFLFFGSIPFDLILNDNFIILFMRIMSFTGGIYYMHLFIFNIFSRFSKVISNKNLKSCIIIYLLCYFISIIFFNIFKYSKFKYLFI